RRSPRGGLLGSGGVRDHPGAPRHSSRVAAPEEEEVRGTAVYDSLQSTVDRNGGEPLTSTRVSSGGVEQSRSASENGDPKLPPERSTVTYKLQYLTPQSLPPTRTWRPASLPRSSCE